ncbi:MAG: ATP-binding protein [Planctomycetia bacterium]
MTQAATDHIRVSLSSDPRFLPLVRALAQQGAELAGFSEAERDTLLLAISEAVSNVIRHAYRDRHDQPIDIDLRVRPGCVEVDVIDRGRFVDPRQIQSRPLDEIRPGGLGVHLMRSTMDVVEYTKNAFGGTTLTLVKRAAPPALA